MSDIHNATTLQQLYKLITGEDSNIDKKNIYPISIIQAIYNGVNGERLDNILGSNNCLWITFNGSIEATRLKVDSSYRRGGLIISFKNYDNIIYTQRYINNTSVSDDDWKANANWEDCFVSLNDNEFINKLKQYISEYVDEKLEGITAIDVDDSLSLSSENPVQNKVITEALNRINKELFPLTISVSGGGLFEKRTSQDITVEWVIREGDSTVVPDALSVNDEPLTTTLLSKDFNDVTTNTTYVVKATKDGTTVQGSTSATFVNPSYFGPVDAGFSPTEEAIKGLTKTIKSTKNYTGNTSLTYQKVCYAYPKSFGALTAIKDANNFDYINSYTRSELTVWDETYYVYVLTDATTIDNFRQIYS